MRPFGKFGVAALENVAIVWAAAVASGAAALAQPLIEDRVVVSYGPTVTNVAECAVAAGPQKVFEAKVVAMWFGGGIMYYSVSTDGARTWSADLVFPLPNGGGIPVDPSVAVSPDGTFVGACLGLQDGVVKIFTAHMPPGSQQFIGGQTIEPPQGGPSFLDRPTVVTGPGPGGETYFYCSYDNKPECILRARTANFGVSWESLGEITSDSGATAEPAVAADAALYTVYRHFENSQYFFRLFKSSDFGQTFTRVHNQPGHLNEQFETFNYNAYVPGPFRVAGFSQLASHPTDANRLYLIFSDLAGPPNKEGDADMDVYLKRSTDAGETWTPRQRINQDVPSKENPEWSDQFFPRITVDGAGRVNVYWYDTRRIPKPASEDPVEIDAFYAWSTDNGQTFTEASLGAAIVFADLVTPGFIGDYNGLTSFGDLVVPVYLGTAQGGQDAPFPEDETIFSNRILH